MKKLIIGLIIVSIGINIYLPFFINERNVAIRKEINNLKITKDSLVKVIDTLKGDIFVKDIQLMRYEYIFDRSEDEMSPECRKELEKIYGETE